MRQSREVKRIKGLGDKVQDIDDPKGSRHR